jgi:hypothetical protein
MAVTAHSLVPVNPRNLMSIDPKNWHRFPPPVANMTKSDAAAKAVTYTGGVANVGAAAGNGGETGTINSTSATRGLGWNTQAEKAAAIGTTMAVDVTKSYHGTRGAIEPDERYPSANTAETPVAFRPSNYIVPGTP